MEQLFDLKKRIKSVTEIGKITTAMQLVSAAKTRKSKARLEDVFPFFTLCVESMIELRKHNKNIENPYFQLRKKKPGEVWRIGYFILTGDQGLAGAYNHNVIRLAEEHIREKKEDNDKKGLNTEFTLYVFGSVGREKLLNDGYTIDPDFSYPITSPTYHNARNVADIIRDKYVSEELDLVYMVYTKMESAIQMKPIVSRIVPVDVRALEDMLPYSHSEEAGMASSSNSELQYFPDADSVFAFLVDTYLNAILYGALVEAFAGEQTARMTAMDNAARNADDMLEKLLLINNRARQERITKELIEIVNGAESIQMESGG